MSYELRKEPAEGVPTPNISHGSYFVDENGQPTLKGSDGTVSPAVVVAGQPLDLNEQAMAPASAIDAGRIYTKDVGGITELFYRDDVGNGGKEAQISDDGVLAGGSTSTWFGSGQMADFNVVVGPITGGSTTTGLVLPILGANQLVTVYFRFMAKDDVGSSSDLGDGGFLFGWGSTPSPGSIVGLILAAFGQATWAAAPLDDITIDGSGVITIVFGTGDTYEGLMRVGVSPGTLLPFDPTA